MRVDLLLNGVLALYLVTACTDDEERPCTTIGSDDGLVVTVAPSLAPVRDLMLDVCADNRCHAHEVRLEPGTVTSDAGCIGTGSDRSCAAKAVRDGTQVGFVDTQIQGPTNVSGSYRLAGKLISVRNVSIEGRPTFPNGPDCGVGGTQAQVILDQNGLR